MNENAKELKSASGWGMVWGILTMLCGFMAIGAPFASGLALTMVFGIALLAAGVSMLIYAFQAPSLLIRHLGHLRGVPQVVARAMCGPEHDAGEIPALRLQQVDPVRAISCPREGEVK